MPTCAAVHCKNQQIKNSGKSFHLFPLRNPELLKRWIIAMGHDKFIPSKNSVLCSDHFEQSCFDKTGQTIRLREGSVPTIFRLLPHPVKKMVDPASFEEFQTAMENVLNECQRNLENNNEAEIKRILEMLGKSMATLKNVCGSFSPKDGKQVSGANVYNLSLEAKRLLMALNTNFINIYKHFDKKLFKLVGVSTCAPIEDINQTSGKIPTDEVLFLHGMGFTFTALANMYNVHYSTISRLIARAGHRRYAPVSDEDLTNIIKALLQESPNIGRRLILSALSDKGINVQRRRVTQILNLLKPAVEFEGKSKGIKRRI